VLKPGISIASDYGSGAIFITGGLFRPQLITALGQRGPNVSHNSVGIEIWQVQDGDGQFAARSRRLIGQAAGDGCTAGFR
jgi:hypothetical protein